MFSVFCY